MGPIHAKLFALGAAVLVLVAGNAAGRAERTGQAGEEPDVALASDLVEVHVGVVDSQGRPVRGLERSNFEVLDNGARQEISHFSDERGPLSLGVVLDAKGMASETVEDTLAALRSSRLVAEHAAEVSFVAFDDRASVETGFVATADEVLPRLRFANRRVPLSIREAVVRAEGGLRASPGSRMLILVITDGGSSLGSRKIVNGVEGGRTELYAVFPTVPVAYGGRSAGVRPDGAPVWPWWEAYRVDAVDRNVNRAAVASLARRSGGRALYAFAESDAARVELFDQIGDEVAGQYAIGFYPSATDAGWHRLVVRLVPPARAKGLSVTHRQGYRATIPGGVARTRVR